MDQPVFKSLPLGNSDLPVISHLFETGNEKATGVV